MQRAVLAGGCFWGMQELLRNLHGVIKTEVGYTGGDFKNPTYEDMKHKKTGHAEAVEVFFDEKILSFENLLKFFFQIHDPTTKNRQGNDVGEGYRSAIFYLDEEQKTTAQNVVKLVDASGKWGGKVVTEIVQAGKFYKAEDFHQDYLQHYPNGYTCHFIRPEWKI